MTHIATFAVLLAVLTSCASGTTAPGTTTSAPVTASPSATVTALPPGNGQAFLAALHSAGIPTSRTGESEILIARGICEQLAAGADPAKLAADLRAGLPTLTNEQVGTFVSLARSIYCR